MWLVGELLTDPKHFFRSFIRQIYPPEREALGVLAIGIELVDPTRTA